SRSARVPPHVQRAGSSSGTAIERRRRSVDGSPPTPRRPREGDTVGRPDRAAALYGALNAISDRLDPFIRRSALKSAITVDLSTVTRVRLFNCPGNQGRYTPSQCGSRRAPRGQDDQATE